MIPRTDVAGFGDSSPWLWPMGAGGPPPRAMTMQLGAGLEVAYRWDGAGRLLEVQRGRPVERSGYVWIGDRLDRLQQFDDHGEELSDPLACEYLWTWRDDDRPIAMRRRSSFDRSGGTVHAWAWTADGRSARITETSSAGLRGAQTVTYDPAGRLVRVERERLADATIDRVLEIAWTDDGRIVSARAGDHVVTYRWDDRGRLIAQTSTQYPGVDVCTYHHDDSAP